MKSTPLLALGFLATASVAFFVGRSTAPAVSNLAADQNDLDTALRNFGTHQRTATFLEMDPADADGAWGGLSGENASAPFAGLSDGALRNQLSQTMALPRGAAGRAETLNQLLQQMAQNDPKAALDFVSKIEGLRDQRNATNTVLESWARENPTAALEWYAANSADLTAVQRSDHIQSILRGYAETSPEGAIRYAQELGEGSATERRLKTSALETVFAQMISDGRVNQTFEALESLENDSMRSTLEVSIMRTWAEQEPSAAAAYLADLGENAPRNSHVALVRSWAEIDPDQAAAHVSVLGTDHPEFGRATATLIARWTNYDIGAPGEWLNSLPASPEVDRAVAIYSSRAAREDPEGAMSWASSIQNDRLRTNMMERVAGDWKEADPTAFDTYLNTSSFTEEQRERLTNASPGDERRGRRGRGW